jgi:hypothetical protein
VRTFGQATTEIPRVGERLDGEVGRCNLRQFPRYAVVLSSAYRHEWASDKLVLDPACRTRNSIHIWTKLSKR